MDTSAYASQILLDDAVWTKTPFAVNLTDERSRTFSTVQEMLEYVMATGYDPSDGETKDVVQKLITAGDDEPSPRFTNQPYLADTRLGWNDAINVLWQFNRDDDIIYPVNQTSDNHGMGRVYSQMIEKNQQILWLTFGVPEFSGMLDFHTNAVNLDMANFMRNGAGDLINQIASFAGSAAGFAVSIPFLPFVWFKKLAQFKNTFNVTKYYDFKATMPLYYQSVTTMLSHLAVNMGFVGGFTDDIEHASSSSNAIEAALPLILQKTGPDIYRIMMQRNEYKLERNTAGTLFASIFGETSADLLKKTNLLDLEQQSKDAIKYNNVAVDSQSGTTATEKDWYTNEITVNDYGGSFLSGIAETAFGALTYVGFRVDKSTDSSESFNNSTGESSLAQSINSKIASNKDNLFSNMYGKTGVSLLDAPIEAAKGFRDALASSLNLDSLLNAYSGSSYVDIPEVWQNSSFGKSYSFEFQLRAPYGDPISIFQSIYVPLCMILAATLPRATGRHSYTSPFLLRGYCKGMFAIPLGIIESLSIRRGSSEFGWNVNKLPTQVDISFSIKDLSPAMYMAIGSGSIVSEVTSVFSQNSSFQEYLTVLGGMGLAERILFFKNLARKWEAMMTTMRNTYGNPLYWSNRIGDSSVIKFVSNFMPYDAIPKN